MWGIPILKSSYSMTKAYSTVPQTIIHLLSISYILIEASKTLNPFNKSEFYSELFVKGNDMDPFYKFEFYSELAVKGNVMESFHFLS
ncbi:14771_t:CDS:1, partial [Gigaspora margarita]